MPGIAGLVLQIEAASRAGLGACWRMDPATGTNDRVAT